MAVRVRNRRAAPKIGTGYVALLLAFSFAVMADPVSSVAYAIEAGLRALHGHLGLLLLTMGLVLGIIAIVRLNYDQLIQRFPEGGGAVAATAVAFGEAWAFAPLGALIVDYVLTISISAAAAASAVIAYFPSLAPYRTLIALVLVFLVAGLTWFGHLGRSVFASMTVSFVAIALVVLAAGFLAPHTTTFEPRPVTTGPASLFTVLLAFPVAMALATGVEAPSSAIAQLGQLDNRGRRRFGRITLWLTFAIEGSLTVLITALAVRLSVGIPRRDSTLIADVAEASVGRGSLFALFQLTSSLLLLAAASSSFQAGPGLLKALSRRDHGNGGTVGILPRILGKTNEHHTPYWSVLVYLVVSGLVVVAAAGREQELILFYAVAVFVSFLAGLLSMARFSRREGDRRHQLVNLFGAAVVAFTILVNLRRGYPIFSLLASAGIAVALYALWVRSGRPRGVAQAEIEAERELGS
ncbi:MAG: APC family permease [Actinobacteria bacterium]|nr:APC family permease [Actinomycetota bacterium]